MSFFTVFEWQIIKQQKQHKKAIYTNQISHMWRATSNVIIMFTYEFLFPMFQLFAW